MLCEPARGLLVRSSPPRAQWLNTGVDLRRIEIEIEMADRAAQAARGRTVYSTRPDVTLSNAAGETAGQKQTVGESCTMQTRLDPNKAPAQGVRSAAPQVPTPFCTSLKGLEALLGTQIFATNNT